MWEVFTLLQNAKLEKCKFLREDVNYLGVTITQDGTETDNQKTMPITLMSPPNICKYMTTFWGMMTWFLIFIERLAVWKFEFV